MLKLMTNRSGARPAMRLAGVFLALSVAMAGCSRPQEYTDIHRQWGLCTLLGAGVGGVIGAGIGFAAAEAFQGSHHTTQPNVCPSGGIIDVGGVTCALVGINAQSGGLNQGGTFGHKQDQDDKYLGLLGGIPGAIIGGLAGHYLCDPVVEAAPPPLPPAPPPVVLPPPPPVIKPPPERLVLRGVHFDFDKYDIRPESEVILDEAAATLKRRPELRVDVNGYCDIIGSDAYNLVLSEKRAGAVRNYLVQQGISPDRLIAHGYGKTNFVASNDTDEGRAQNRRVELIPVQ